MFPYSLMALEPWAFAFVMYMFVSGVMFRGRHVHQKQPFQVSYSAFFGGAAICSIFAIAGNALNSKGTSIPSGCQDIGFHVVAIFASFGVGQVFQFWNHGWRRSTWHKTTDKMDLVYAQWLLPLLAYFFILSVVVAAESDSNWPAIWMTVLVAVFALMYYYDEGKGLLNQLAFVRANPVTSVTDAYKKV